MYSIWYDGYRTQSGVHLIGLNFDLEFTIIFRQPELY